MRALITGASSGIGLELARCFAIDHYDLVLTGRALDRLEALATELRNTYAINVAVIAQDLSTATGAQALFNEVSERGLAITYLVNNAGFGLYGEFMAQSLGDQRELMQLNMLSLSELTRLFTPAMVAARNGRILNVASTISFVSAPLMALYGASKAFVLSLSEALAHELQGSGVTVTCLCPGPTASNFGERSGFAMPTSGASRVAGAAEVARFGYAALFAGETVAIHGAANRLLALSTRFAPRKMITAATAKILASGKN